MNKSWAREDSIKGPLTIGLMMSDGIADPHPPIVRSLQETVKALEAAGHKVIPWKPVFQQEILEVIIAMYFIDGGSNIRAVLQEGGEEPITLLTVALSNAGAKPTIEKGWEVSYAESLFEAMVN